MLTYKSLSQSDYDAVMSIMRARFGEDCYKTISGEVFDDFRESVEYCLFEGDSRGVVTEDGTLVGFLLAFNYDVVPEKTLCKLFGCSSYEDLPRGGHIHNAIRDKWFVTYIVTVAILQEYESDVSVLLEGMRHEFCKGHLVSETSDKSLYEAYLKVGFYGVAIDDGRYYVSSSFKTASGVVAELVTE